MFFLKYPSKNGGILQNNNVFVGVIVCFVHGFKSVKRKYGLKFF